jgi:hypothetical protein
METADEPTPPDIPKDSSKSEMKNEEEDEEELKVGRIIVTLCFFSSNQKEKSLTHPTGMIVLYYIYRSVVCMYVPAKCFTKTYT